VASLEEARLSGVGARPRSDQNRVIDSLIYIEFIFFLEELSGYELQSHAEDANRFRTLRSIRDNVLSGKGLERVA